MSKDLKSEHGSAVHYFLALRTLLTSLATSAADLASPPPPGDPELQPLLTILARFADGLAKLTPPNEVAAAHAQFGALLDSEIWTITCDGKDIFAGRSPDGEAELTRLALALAECQKVLSVAAERHGVLIPKNQP